MSNHRKTLHRSTLHQQQLSHVHSIEKTQVVRGLTM